MNPEYFAYLRELERQHGLPPGLLAVQQQAESDFNPNAVSKAGAQGIAQFMPATAQEYGIDPFDPMQAAPAQAKMMAGLLSKYGGDVPKALAGYNWGQGNVDRKGMDNAPEETRNYISRIVGGLGSAAGPAPDSLGDISDEELQQIANSDSEDAGGLSDMSDEELQKIASGDQKQGGFMDDLLQLPERAALGLAKGLVGTGMTNYAIPAGKAIAGALANYGTDSMKEYGKAQQKEIADFEKSLGAIMPRIIDANGVADVGEAAGAIAGGIPLYLANPLSMIAGGAASGGQQAYEKTGGDAEATMAGAGIGAALNAVPGYLLGAGKGLVKSAAGMGAMGAVTPALQRIPERVAGMEPEPISSDERLNAALSGALMGGIGHAITGAGKTQQAKIPTTEQVHEAAGKMYEAAAKSGAAIKPEAVRNWSAKVEKLIPPEKIDVMKTYGGDGTLTRTLEALRGEADRGGMTLERGMALYQQLGDMVMSHTAINGKMDATGKVLNDIKQDLHGLITKPGQNDILGGAGGFKAYTDGMRLWATQAKMADVDAVLRKAEASDNPHLAIKNGFASLYKNAKKTKGWSKEEQAALLKASQLGASGEAMRFVGGRLFPLITAGAGVATGGVMGIPAAAAAYGAANLARSGATKIQTKRANDLKSVIVTPQLETINRALNPQKQEPKSAMETRLDRVATVKPPPVAAPVKEKPAEAKHPTQPAARTQAPQPQAQPATTKAVTPKQAAKSKDKYEIGSTIKVGMSGALEVIGKDGDTLILAGKRKKDGTRQRFTLSADRKLKKSGSVRDLPESKSKKAA